MGEDSKQGGGDGAAEESASDRQQEIELSEVIEERPTPSPEAPSDLPIDLDQAIKQKDKELSDLKDKYLRLAADYDNFKKRIQKEKADQLKYGNEHLARRLLDAIDNLERAISHADASDKQALIEGITLVDNMFLQTLEKFGIKRFSALGQPFDPAYHEAVQEVHSPDVPAGAVVFEVHKGYTYYDRLLRPARVVLSKGPPPADSGEGSGSAQGGGSAGDLSSSEKD